MINHIDRIIAMPQKRFTDSDLLNYILDHHFQPGDQLPALNELSDQLGINVGKLREQLEVARSLGLVEVRPRTGIRCKPYDFSPAVRLSLLYALSLNRESFLAFSELRNHLEVAFWNEAVKLLTIEDRAELRILIAQARAKLGNVPFIQIPHDEHRRFHMGIFARFQNPFVTSLLESYWEAYEAVELNAYADLDYWQEAWDYHERILDYLDQNDYEGAKEAFIAHTRLLRHRKIKEAENEGSGASSARPIAELISHSPRVSKEK